MSRADQHDACDLTYFVDEEGAVHISNVKIPFSLFASEASKSAFLDQCSRLDESAARLARYGGLTLESIEAMRQGLVSDFCDVTDRVAALYPTFKEDRTVNGVPVEVFRSLNSPRESSTVVINLHGGSWLGGGGVLSHLESAPLAHHIGGTVVAVDYRHSPEYRFPAATDDTIKVYEGLLRDYSATQIGICGFSAGALLTAQTVAAIDARGLPKPAAIGMFAGSASGCAGGDSGALAWPLVGLVAPSSFNSPPRPTVLNLPYFDGIDMSDPLVDPVQSPSLLSKFPPTLLITSTRDAALSGAAHTHTQLSLQGVDSHFHVWDGLPHNFFVNWPELPESKEAWTLIKRFFEKHLALKPMSER